jgi:hypothetical protein
MKSRNISKTSQKSAVKFDVTDEELDRVSGGSGADSRHMSGGSVLSGGSASLGASGGFVGASGGFIAASVKQ